MYSIRYILEVSTGPGRSGPGRAGPKKNICGPGRAGNFGPVDTSNTYRIVQYGILAGE